jgi:chromosome segregation ATPase
MLARSFGTPTPRLGTRTGDPAPPRLKPNGHAAEETAVSTAHDLTSELSALSGSVAASTERLRALGERAPELRQIVVAVEDRLAQRTDELGRAKAEVHANADRIAGLRTQLGELEERLASFRGRLASIAGMVGEGPK